MPDLDVVSVVISTLFAIFSVSILAAQSIRHRREMESKDRILESLLDRLMSRDFGEFAVVRQERTRPETKQSPPPFYETEEENVLAFQGLGDEWTASPAEWLDRLNDET